MRLQAFSKAAGLPMECPRLKVAVLKWSYSQDPNYGFCPVPDCGKIRELPDAGLRGAEAVLHNIHGGMASLFGELDEHHRIPWLGNVDAKAASVLLTAKSCASFASAAARVEAELTALCVELAQLIGEREGLSM